MSYLHGFATARNVSVTVNTVSVTVDTSIKSHSGSFVRSDCDLRGLVSGSQQETVLLLECTSTSRTWHPSTTPCALQVT